ncbi:hypothetical protein ACWC98_35675 [Streptomyces goshikiensis]
MSRKWVTAERYVKVEYSSFVVQDFHENDERASPPVGESGGLLAGTRSVRVMSLLPDHEVEVVVESWDGEPPDADGDGQLLVGEEVMESQYGVVLLQQWQGELPGGPIALGMPGRYRLRVWRTTTFDPAERGRVAYGGVTEGLESYRIQAWPEAA